MSGTSMVGGRAGGACGEGSAAVNRAPAACLSDRLAGWQAAKPAEDGGRSASCCSLRTQASPHVAGAVALILQANPTASVAQVGGRVGGWVNPHSTGSCLASHASPTHMCRCTSLLTPPCPRLQVRDTLNALAATITFSASTPAPLLQVWGGCTRAGVSGGGAAWESRSASGLRASTGRAAPWDRVENPSAPLQPPSAPTGPENQEGRKPFPLALALPLPGPARSVARRRRRATRLARGRRRRSARLPRAGQPGAKKLPASGHAAQQTHRGLQLVGAALALAGVLLFL